MSKVFFVLLDEIKLGVDYNNESLYKIVHHEKYDQIVMVGEQKTLDYKKIFQKNYYKYYHERIKVNVLILNNIDNINYVYKRLKYKIKEYPYDKIVINYTHGSSKLSAISMIIARKYGLKIQEKCMIDDMSEITQFNVVEEDNATTTSLYFVKKSFNNYNFNLALELLEENYSQTDKIIKKLKELIKLYNKWDSLEYAEYDFDGIIKFFNNLKILPDNKKAMKILADKNNKLYYSYQIADLINNSYRRIKEYKYNDAIIRLYRTLELIAQARLYLKYSIRITDVHKSQLKNLDIEQYALNKIIQRLDFKYPKYNLPLSSSFFLLQKLYDEVGTHYYNNKDKYQQLFQKRNISVLVHGNHKYHDDEIMQMYDLVYSMAKVYDVDIDKYISVTKFPQFNI